MRRLAIIGITALCLAIPAQGFTENCEGGFIHVGDSAGKVLKRCGKPQGTTTTKIGLSSHEEIWYYDFGGRRIPFNVTVRDGKVIKIESD